MISSWDVDPDIILLDDSKSNDFGMAMNNEKILLFIRRINKSLPVIFLQTPSDVDKAPRMLQSGNIDFIKKDPDVITHLLQAFSRELEARKFREKLSKKKTQIKKYLQYFFSIVLFSTLTALTLFWLNLLFKAGSDNSRTSAGLTSTTIVLFLVPLLFIAVVVFSEFTTLSNLIRAFSLGKKLQNKALDMQMDNRLLMDNLEYNDGTE
jgi:hypothetical protein